MLLAFLVVNVEPGAEDRVLDSLKKLSHVKEAYVTWGVYDIMAKIETKDQNDLKGSITGIRQLPSIKNTLTLLVTDGHNFYSREE